MMMDKENYGKTFMVGISHALENFGGMAIPFHYRLQNLLHK
jgi:hypothetical protein